MSFKWHCQLSDQVLKASCQLCDMMHGMNVQELRDQLQSHQMERIPFNQVPPAAVLIPLVTGVNGEWDVVLEVRAAHITQGGEVSLPGGRIEDGESGEEAAVRETVEELFIAAGQVEVICPMVVTTGPRGRDVYAYLGVLTDYQGTFSPSEVDHVLTVPLRTFYEAVPQIGSIDLIGRAHDDFPSDLLSQEQGPWFHSIPRSFYFYETQDHVIWGLTALILREAARIVYGDEHQTR